MTRGLAAFESKLILKSQHFSDRASDESNKIGHVRPSASTLILTA